MSVYWPVSNNHWQIITKNGQSYHSYADGQAQVADLDLYAVDFEQGEIGRLLNFAEDPHRVLVVVGRIVLLPQGKAVLQHFFGWEETRPEGAAADDGCYE